ncbi:MAG: hypothetical protein ACREH5_08165, partial [Candidatus Omnitrophota bacterium]
VTLTDSLVDGFNSAWAQRGLGPVRRYINAALDAGVSVSRLLDAGFSASQLLDGKTDAEISKILDECGVEK